MSLLERIEDRTAVIGIVGWAPTISLDETLRQVIAYEESSRKGAKPPRGDQKTKNEPPRGQGRQGVLTEHRNTGYR